MYKSTFSLISDSLCFWFGLGVGGCLFLLVLVFWLFFFPFCLCAWLVGWLAGLLGFWVVFFLVFCLFFKARLLCVTWNVRVSLKIDFYTVTFLED